MNYIGEIFTRADIQQIRSFLIMQSAHVFLHVRLHRDYPDEKDFEEISQPIYDYVSVIEEVYMEIGLQVGAKLTAQTVQNLKIAFDGE